MVKTRTPEQTEHNKRMALKRYWYRQYGIAIQNDEQYDFFKRNRILILKTMPLLDQINDLQFHQTDYDNGEAMLMVKLRLSWSGALDSIYFALKKIEAK